MAPTSTSIALSSAAPAQTSSQFITPFGGTPPNIPDWVPCLSIVLFSIAILALLYRARQSSRVWEEHVEQLITITTKPYKKGNVAQWREKLKLPSVRDTKAYTAPTKESATQNAVDPLSQAKSASRVTDTPVAPADDALPSSDYALAHMTRANTLKNQRWAELEAPLPPILRPDGASW
ncbi:hypothetical protein K438DRAFT_2007033 [Mycena galopus ATCC 62051]|nr:hypothetical protein K438DRAFT_2007033 [Mycena galopus ATCC 62051]